MKSPLKRATQARRERRRQAMDALDAAAHLNGVPAPVQALAPVDDGADDGVRLIPLKFITASPLNPRRRFDEASLAELASSIRAKGILQPVLLRPRPGSGTALPAYEIVAGERRCRAAAMAGLAVVPAMVRRLSDRDLLEAAVIENEQREDVGPMERADGYARLVEQHGVSVEELARRVGKSESTIRGVLRLRALPEIARVAVEQGRLAPAVAGLVARVPGMATRGKLALHVLAGKEWWGETPKVRPTDEPLGYRETKALIQRHCTRELKGAPFRPERADLVAEAGACTSCPKRAGNLKLTDPDGYGDARADLCTDPECFGHKVAAQAAQDQAAARASGQTVLSAAESARVFPYGRTDLPYSTEYFDLDGKCVEDPKKRTYRTLVGKALAGEVVVALDGGGRARHLIAKAQAMPVLRETHRIGVGQRDVAGSKEALAAKRRQQEERRRIAAGQAAAAEAQARVAQLAAATPAVPGAKDLDRLRALTGRILEHAWHEARKRVEKRRGASDLAAHIETMSLGEMLGLIAELVAAREAGHWGHAYRSDAADDEFWKPWGIEPKALIAAAGKKGGTS